MRLTVVRVHFEAAQTEIKQFNPGPSAIERGSGKDHQICRLDGTMGQAVSSRFREHVHDLKADAQNGVCRHRTVRAHPSRRGVTLQIFGHESEVIVLDSDIKNSGEISVIQLLRHSRVFFKSDAFHFINTGKRDELHRHHSTTVVTDRFISNDGAAARDLARRSIVV